MPKSNDDFFKEKKDWSIVKDKLLGGYLIPYFSKIFNTRYPLLYIDAFSGKGKFDDGENGSPLIALECLCNCLQMHKGNPEVCMKFIELNHALELEDNLSEEHKKYSQVISGEFEENITSLLDNAFKKNPNHNVFLYIDPYGVKALNAELFDMLPQKFGTAELLINLNSWGFLRMAFAVQKIQFQEEQEVLTYLEEYSSSLTGTINEINEIAGGDYWQSIVDRYKNNQIDGYQAEKDFSNQYKLRLRQKYAYVLDMPIRLKASNHPKYRMVYATNHPDGCILMADNIAKRTEHLIVAVQNLGQMSLFPETADNEIVSDDELRTKIRKLLDNHQSYIRLNKFLAEFYTEYGVLCPSPRLKEILKQLEKVRYIEVKRNPASTPSTGKPSRFWSDEKGKILELQKKSN